MCDAVIVEAIRTPIGQGKPTRALAGDPVGSISPSLPDKVVRRHAR